MSLAVKYRPKMLKDFLGNEGVIKSLRSMMEREEIPHTLLFTGPSGCGKTTLARIVATRLKCSQYDFTENNAADFRGIDSVRDILRQMTLSPMSGPCRVWLLDECFAKGTPIEIPGGCSVIERMIPGDSVYSLKGETKVLHTFQNKVQLDRVVCLHLTNGKSIVTTKDHLFYTNKGWKPAKDLLKKDLLFSFFSNIMGAKKERNSLYEKMCMVWKGLQAQPVPPRNVFKVLWSTVKKSSVGHWKIRKKILPVLQPTDDPTEVQPSGFLQPVMPCKMENETTVLPSEDLQCGGIRKNITSSTDLQNKVSGTGQSDLQNEFRPNETKKSNAQPENHRKDETDENTQRDTPSLERSPWWKQSFYCTSNYVVSLGQRPDGILCKHNAGNESHQEPSEELQDRCGLARKQDCNRGGRRQSPNTNWSKNRQKEGFGFADVRVESITFYERKSESPDFTSIIGNQERDQGFVIFYDLEIDRHPSYFANGCAVHNCHQLSKDGQHALLKALEDTPKHVYFLLATTDPEKLLPTIKTRCVTFDVKPLNDNLMDALLKSVLQKEGVDNVPQEALDQIVQDSLGSARMALSVLDGIINMEPADMLEAAKQTTSQQNAAIDLCRALIGKRPWREIAKIIQGLDQEPESVRRAVLGYASAVLLKSSNPQAYCVIDSFRQDFFTTGKAGLVLSAYAAVN